MPSGQTALIGCTLLHFKLMMSETPSKRTPFRLIRSAATDVEAISYVSSLCACPINRWASRIRLAVPRVPICMPQAIVVAIVALLGSITAPQAASSQLQ